MCQKDGMISTSICTFKNPDLKYLFSLPQTFLTSFLNMFCLLLQKKNKSYANFGNLAHYDKQS